MACRVGQRLRALAASARASLPACVFAHSCPQPLAQVRRWSEQLTALRQAAPDADRQWLSANTKRCPRCQAHIQVRAGQGAGMSIQPGGASVHGPGLARGALLPANPPSVSCPHRSTAAACT